jgi:hypothetical protein
VSICMGAAVIPPGCTVSFPRVRFLATFRRKIDEPFATWQNRWLCGFLQGRTDLALTRVRLADSFM